MGSIPPPPPVVSGHQHRCPPPVVSGHQHRWCLGVCGKPVCSKCAQEFDDGHQPGPCRPPATSGYTRHEGAGAAVDDYLIGMAMGALLF